MLEQKWPETTAQMKETYELSNVAKRMWLDPVKPISVNDNEICLMVTDEDFLPYIRKCYESKFQETINKLLQTNCTIKMLA